MFEWHTSAKNNSFGSDLNVLSYVSRVMNATSDQSSSSVALDLPVAVSLARCQTMVSRDLRPAVVGGCLILLHLSEHSRGIRSHAVMLELCRSFGYNVFVEKVYRPRA